MLIKILIKIFIKISIRILIKLIQYNIFLVSKFKDYNRFKNKNYLVNVML